MFIKKNYYVNKKMDFEDSPYSVQQIHARTRSEKVNQVDRDAIEKQRLAARHEHYERHNPVSDPVKPNPDASYAIDDVERFNRDYCADQKAEKKAGTEMIWKRAAHRRMQQEEYERQIEARRKYEEDEARKKIEASNGDFNEESVLYDPITNGVPDETTKKGATLRERDMNLATKREIRAKRIYHASNSNQYDPITGELRPHW